LSSAHLVESDASMMRLRGACAGWNYTPMGGTVDTAFACRMFRSCSSLWRYIQWSGRPYRFFSYAGHCLPAFVLSKCARFHSECVLAVGPLCSGKNRRRRSAPTQTSRPENVTEHRLLHLRFQAFKSWFGHLDTLRCRRYSFHQLIIHQCPPQASSKIALHSLT
jgi:hypothetical protein